MKTKGKKKEKYLSVLDEKLMDLDFQMKGLDNINSWTWLQIAAEVNHRAVFLKALTRIMNIPIRSIAEIGVWKGESSKLFSYLFPEAELYLIDPWKPYSRYFSEEAGPISKEAKDFENAYLSVKETFRDNPKCKIIRKTSLKGAAEISGDLDLVFIDGNHSYEYVKQDIEIWLPKLRSGGILSGHDFSPRFPGVMQAVNESFSKDLHIGCETVWYYIKP